MERMCYVRRRHQRSRWTAHATHIRGRTVYRLLRTSLGTDLGEILRKGVEAPRELTYPQSPGFKPAKGNIDTGMNTGLQGKVIVITGASGAIGSAIARQFAAEGV